MKNRIGIVGGGQLGRMLAFEAKRLGFYVTVIDPTPGSPAGQVVDRQIVADFTDEEAIRKLAGLSDYMTFEIELANASLLDELTKQGVSINPSAQTLFIIKDKLKQKKFLKRLKIPTALFRVVENQKNIEQAAYTFGYPLMLKARFDGYDGRGNAVISSKKDIAGAFQKLSGRKLYVEKWVSFKKELAVMAARSIRGEIVTYPVVETIHRNNICHLVIAPAQISNDISFKARNLAEKTMRHLQGAGVFGIEMFLTDKNDVLINEIAPRVHNSGHYTIESCMTNQFEQHIRAITHLPLGKTELVVPCTVMINILGERVGQAKLKGLHKALRLEGVSIHIYNKIETKVDRKMGHITAHAHTAEDALQLAQKARSYISI